ncbi:MAG TPA: hypothetical protein GXX18_19900, partial [Bacillales bacterium]|nr:hypothetical protein [Bacillales bacterium]
DLAGAVAGTGFTTLFRPLGEAVAIVGSTVAITDVDKLADGTPDTLTSAKVFIASGALNNLGPTKFETLSSTAGASLSTASGAVLAISGNGSSDASPLTITGVGSWADYEEALRTLRYHNASDSAAEGDRAISVSVTDVALTTGGVGALESIVATSTVQVVWAPVQDLNGSGTPGRGYSTTFVEDATGVAIADTNAVIHSGVSGKVTQMVATLTNPADGTSGADESLFIDANTLAALQGAGFTVSGNATHVLTLSGTLDKALYGMALQSIQYRNTSQNPSATDRVVQVAVTGENAQIGSPVFSTIQITPVNDAPSDIALSGTTIALNAAGISADGQVSSAVEVGTVTVTDVDNASHTLTLGGADGALFEVVGGKLRLKPGITLDPAAKYSYAIRLIADDGEADNNTYGEDFTIKLTESDAPVFSVATVSGNTVTLVFQDRSRLDSANVPAPTDFTVTGHTVTAVDVPDDASKAVVLTLAPAPAPGSAITVGYTLLDSGGKLQDTSGNLVASFAGKPVIHGTIDPATSTITVSSGGTVPAPVGDFTLVNTGTNPVTLTDVADGQTVTLSGSGPVTISNPTGSLGVDNTGTGTVT